MKLKIPVHLSHLVLKLHLLLLVHVLVPGQLAHFSEELCNMNQILSPFTIVKDKGFRRLINLLDPRYVLPSPYTLSGKLLETTYQEVHQKLKNDLTEIKYVAITSDSWTSSVSESYLTVTCHYINSAFELKSIILSTKPLANGMNHTSENIAESLESIFREWNIENKIVCIVTDNAANMIKTCELLKIRHLPCYAHSLNLVVQENFNDLKTNIKRCKDIVTFIKSSNVAMEIFKKEQNIDDDITNKQYKLIQEVPTRWNSTFYMIERILKTNEAISRTLLKVRKAPQPLSVDELSILNDVVKVLKCFEEATKKISGGSYVTISLIIPLTFGIYNFLNAVITELDTEEGKLFCSGLIESVKKRIFPYESRNVTKIGTIIDPRFKKEGFRNPENASSAAVILEQEMQGALRQKSQSQNININEPSVSQNIQTSPSLFAFLESRISGKIKSVTSDVIITRRQYLERANSAEDADPLLFWKISGNELTPMDECARKFLCIPATSVESERSFSSAGQVITDRRSKLKSTNVDKLIFLHKNLNITDNK
ncbi:zinc finger BED domain-containing protein 4-like isoform X2 [Sitophilus oryzae]|uniref:Zinc finger BED domain-containing protein 4-like isoform X2 n=1 Tax=Sitophilus oryzae TaxID=7048 RepID=A0A6J2YL69_SITOR|nr:zinc finger BED domain-containing protein 4-like isoform X2 [Sitophilus oryzae]